MAANGDVQAASLAFDETARIPIAQLNPDVATRDLSNVQADVVLVWPYSSSTRQISLLLAEHDVRLRKSKGQVKVTFHGECAKEVAKTQVGIGDSVKLSLRGTEWTRTGQEISTPGKKVDWDIVIKSRLILEVRKPTGSISTVDVVARSSSPTKPRSVTVIDGPGTDRIIGLQKNSLSGSHFTKSHHTPVRLSSGSFVDASLDPFAEDGDYISGRSHKRTKFSRPSGSWRLLDSQEASTSESETPSSPLERQLQSNTATEPLTIIADIRLQSSHVDIIDEDLVVDENQHAAPLMKAKTEGLDSTGMPTAGEDHNAERRKPPDPADDTVLDSAAVLEDIQPTGFAQVDGALAMSPTPVLRPILSPELALVSPLVQRSGIATGYFPTETSYRSELDATSHSDTDLGDAPDRFAVLSQAGTLHAGPRTYQFLGAHEMGYTNDQDLALVGENMDGILNHETIANGEDLDVSSNILHESLLEQAAAVFGSDSFIPPSASADEIDLDALQQQIEQSTSLWQGPTEPTQIEHEDMYGPPVHTSDSMIIAEDLEARQNLETTDKAAKTPQDLVQHQVFSPLAVESIHSSPLDEVVSTEPTIDDTDLLPSAAPVFIDTSSEDDVSVTQSLHEQTEESEISQDESPVIVQGVEDDVQHSDSGKYQDDTDDAETQHLANRPGSAEEHESESVSIISAIELPVHAAPVQLHYERSISHTDGANDQPEEEPTILHDTQEAPQNGFTDEEVLNLLSSPPFAALEIVNNHDLEHEPEIRLAQHPHVDLNSDESEEASDEDHAPSEQDVSDLIVVSPVVKPVVEDDGQIHHAALQFLTPDASQHIASSALSLVPIALPPEVLLPPSPQPTQELAMADSPSKLAETLKELPELPSTMTPKDNNRFVRRSSPRLSRKSFTTEVIVSEYFTPRRSARIDKSFPPPLTDASILDPPTSPLRSQRILRSSSPLISQDLAIDSAKSKSTPRGISTPLSYFPFLSTVGEYFNLQIDVMAVCTTESTPVQKAKSGPQDSCTTFCIADTSLAKSKTAIRVRIFRPWKKAVPKVRRGDIVLLRNMKVQTRNHRSILLSTISSAWAVFKDTNEADFDIIVSGPPIEYNEHETLEADRLRKWWMTEGEHGTFLTAADNDEVPENTQSSPARATRSQRRKANLTDNYGNSYEHENLELNADLASSPTSTAFESSQVPVHSSPAVPKKRARRPRNNSQRVESVVHELRDGTKYIDDDGRQRSTSVIHELRDGSTYIDE